MKSMNSNSNPLQEFDNIADRIRLHSQASRAPVLIVEGVSDKRVNSQWLPEADIFPALSRDQAVSTLREILPSLKIAIACILDEDFQRPVLSELEHARVAYYSGRDLESAFIRSGALARVLLHFLPQHEDETKAREIVDQATECCRPISELRLASYRHSLGLNFDRIGFGEFFSSGDHSFDTEGYIQRLCQIRENEDITPEVVTNLVTDVDDELGPRGRDILKVAARLTLSTNPKFRGNLADMLEAALFSTSWVDRPVVEKVRAAWSLAA